MNQPLAVPQKGATQVRTGGAFFVAAGIFLSRIAGLVRTRVFAYYFGVSVPAAAFTAAMRIPNFLQNLFGEGVLSASFIPVYARLLGKGEQEAADEVAGAIFGWLSLCTALLVALGLWGSPTLVDILSPGFEGEARALTIRLVRIIFPGVGLLVLSAWCLGILNSHRKFFVSYVVPVLWNGAIIVSMAWFGGRTDADDLILIVAWGTVAGGFLQFGFQLPQVLSLLGRWRPSVSLRHPGAREVLRSFGPVLGGRGVVQLSAYFDQIFASWIAVRAVASLQYAQMIYLLPVSLFGTAISAAELPEMARAIGSSNEISVALRMRLEAGLSRLAFLVIPSAAAFLFLGDVTASALFQTGQFGPDESRYVWCLLMGSAVGLLAGTQGRLYASAFYALKDPQTPLTFAIVRVVVSASLTWGLALQLPRALGLPEAVSVAGITLASGIAATVEYGLLRRRLGKALGKVGLPTPLVLRLWFCASLAAGVALGVKMLLVRVYGTHAASSQALLPSVLPAPALHPIATAAAVLGVYGTIYGLSAFALRIPEASLLMRRFLRRR